MSARKPFVAAYEGGYVYLLVHDRSPQYVPPISQFLTPDEADELAGRLQFWAWMVRENEERTDR